MDVSDGLVGDLTKLLRVSGVSGRIDLPRIPLSDAARAAIIADPSIHERLFTGGDDYEIVCTVPPDASGSFEAAAQKALMDVTAIGVVEGGTDAACFLDRNGRKRDFLEKSFSQF
jgi:thiamine-monophosphate kinase